MANSIPNNAFPDKGNWTSCQLKLAFYLYCQLPFGKLTHSNKEIIRLAGLIHRTPSSVAMKLCNFASLDPAIRNSGRKGLDGASKADRDIWKLFHNNWEALAKESESLLLQLTQGIPFLEEDLKSTEMNYSENDFTGETKKGFVNQRIRQSFFRRSVLAGYGGVCCISGLAEPNLLVASHIVPWSKDKGNRLNPSNGLLLSAIHDRAFDKGLMTLSSDFEVILSRKLRKTDNEFLKKVFLDFEGKSINLPDRFVPKVEFVEYHQKNVFQDSSSR